MGLIQERSRLLGPFLRERRILLFWTLALAAVLTQIGSEHQSAATWVAVFLFWCLHVGIGLLITTLVMTLLQKRFGILQPTMLLLISAGLLGALIFAPIAVVLDSLGSQIGLTSEDAGGGLWSTLVDEFMVLAPVFVAMWLVVQLPFLLVLREAKAPVADPPGADTSVLPPPVNGLLNKLPATLGTEIISVEADLNYIHVTTSQGKTMLLYSLRQAAEDLGSRGLLAHRSIWVAKAAVTRVRKSAGVLRLWLVNGRVVKVSRRRQAAVVAEFGTDFSR